ncbi:MAG: hypothetical protein ACREBS_01640, partial [Nitrososphaerales archaeon]
IGALDDASALPELEEWLKNETSGSVRRRLRETMHQLRQGKQTNDQIEAVEKQLKIVAQKVEKLEQQSAPLQKLDESKIII